MAATLSTEQCQILGALLDLGASPPDRTTERLAARLDMSPRQVGSRLAELAARSPPLVRRVFDEEWQVLAWLPTVEGREAHDGGCPGDG
jgi:hypothetical protein